MAAAPLSGKLILDCSAHLPGAFAAMLLQRQGARVVRIVRAKSEGLHPELAAFYDAANEGKQLEPLDLSAGHPDRTRFEALVRQAHGLIEGYRPSVRTKLGLDAAHLHALNPSLHIVSISGFAEADPRTERPVHDLNLQALSGALGLFASLPGLPLAQLFTAYQAALELASALVMSAGKSGQATVPGTHAAVDAMSALKVAQTCARGAARTADLAADRVTGKGPSGDPLAPGHTLLTGRYPCYRVYSTGEGRKVSVAAIEPRYWQLFCQAISSPELVERQFAEGEAGADAAVRVQRILASQPWKYWAQLFDKNPCCVEPVLSYAEIP